VLARTSWSTSAARSPAGCGTDGISSAGSTLASNAPKVLNAIWGGLESAARAVRDFGKRIPGWITDGRRHVSGPAFKDLTKFFTDIFTNMLGGGSGGSGDPVKKGGKSIIPRLIGGLKEEVAVLYLWVTDLFTNLFGDDGKKNGGGAGDPVRKGGKSIIHRLVAGLEEEAVKIFTWFVGLPDKISKWWDGVDWNKVKDKLISILKADLNNAKAIAEFAGILIALVAGAVVLLIIAIPAIVLLIVAALVTALVQTLEKKFPAFAEAFKVLFQQLATTVISVFGTIVVALLHGVAGIMTAYKAWGDGTFTTVRFIEERMLDLAKIIDAVTGSDLASSVRRAIGHLDDMKQGFDKGAQGSIDTVERMARVIQQKMDSLNGKHVTMRVDANGNVNINDMGLTHQQIADFHGVGADGGILRAYANGGLSLPNMATIQPAVGSRGLVQWAEPETHGEAFIPLAPTKRARSLDVWEQTGKLLGAFADGGINFADRASAPIVEGLNRFERLAIETVSRLASRTMKQVQGAYNAQNFGGASSNDIINFAESFVGKTPYVWGGTTPSGWDCSGFTSWVYNHFGIGAPRTSEAQQAWARPSPDVPGALAFFGRPAGHVGISLGGGRMVDAAHSGTMTRNEGIWSDITGFGLPPGGLGKAGVTTSLGGGPSFGGSINEAVYQALKLNGLPASLSGIVLRQIMTESGGNANAVQGIVDVNSGNGGANLARAGSCR